MSVQQERFTEIADAIRSKTGETDLIKPSDFAGKVEDVYDAGKQAEHDRFWDSFQRNGTRIDYQNAFSSPSNVDAGWNMETFKPKYDIKPTQSVSRMFYGTTYLPIDLRSTAFKQQFGVDIDLSEITTIEQFLSGSAIFAVGTISVTKVSSRLYYAFFSATKLQTIEKLILPMAAEPSMNTTAAFMNCNALTTILEIEGVFGNSISFSYSPLGKDTIMRIMNALADYSDGSYKKTLTLGTKNLAKLTDAEKVVATEKGWTLA